MTFPPASPARATLHGTEGTYIWRLGTRQILLHVIPIYFAVNHPSSKKLNASANSSCQKVTTFIAQQNEKYWEWDFAVAQPSTETSSFHRFKVFTGKIKHLQYWDVELMTEGGAKKRQCPAISSSSSPSRKESA